LIFVLILVVYLTNINLKRLHAFGNFIIKILKVLPITSIIKMIYKNLNN